MLLQLLVMLAAEKEVMEQEVGVVIGREVVIGRVGVVFGRVGVASGIDCLDVFSIVHVGGVLSTHEQF